MAKPKKLKWADAPSEHDYPAAASFLRLIASPPASEALAGLLSHAPTVHHPVKDILRAARLSLLPADDAEVAKDLKKVAEGTALSPILLVRGDLATGRAPVSYTHLRAHETPEHLVCRLLLEKKKKE